VDDLTDRFGAAVEEIAKSAQSKEVAGGGALMTALSELEAMLAVRFRLSAGDASEAASEAMTRFLERCEAGDVDPERAAGLLSVMARNIAVDMLRMRTRETPTEDIEKEVDHRASREDEISALLDRRADRAAIRDAMASLLALNDLATVRVAKVWLDLADELGRAPTTREVAAAAGVSHSTIQRSLQTFREFVPSDPPGTKSY
jgi:hypothetical protein